MQYELGISLPPPDAKQRSPAGQSGLEERVSHLGGSTSELVCPRSVCACQACAQEGNARAHKYVINMYLRFGWGGEGRPGGHFLPGLFWRPLRVRA